MVLVLAIGTSRTACGDGGADAGSCGAAAAACYTARWYCCILLAALLLATVYCLPYVCEYDLLLLAINIRERLAATGTCCGHP